MAEPVGQGGFVEVTARQRKDGGDDLFFRCINAEAVQTEEEIHGLKGDALVAVHEGMIARESKPVRGRESGKVGLGVVKEAIARAFEGGLQESPVPEPEGPAVGSDLIRMDSEDLYLRNPTWFGHLASSRMALR